MTIAAAHDALKAADDALAAARIIRDGCLEELVVAAEAEGWRVIFRHNDAAGHERIVLEHFSGRSMALEGVLAGRGAVRGRTRKSDWSIKLPYRDRDDPLPTVADACRVLESDEDRAVARSLVLSGVTSDWPRSATCSTGSPRWPRRSVAPPSTRHAAAPACQPPARWTRDEPSPRTRPDGRPRTR